MGMNAWPFAAIVAVLTAAGCATSPVGTGTGRYLVQRDQGMVFSQLEASTPRACAQLRAQLAKTQNYTSAQKLDCENVDQSDNLPYALSLSDATGPMRLTSLSRTTCTAWESVMSKTPGVTVTPGGCPASPPGAIGKRFYQVRDHMGTAYVQYDLGTEANCRQLEKIRAASGSSPKGSVQYLCTDESRSSQMRYTLRFVSASNLPVLEMDVVDKFFCDTAITGSEGQYPGYRAECNLKR